MIEIRVSVACRTCSAGWYGAPGDRCPRCAGEVVVTDLFAAVDLADLSVVRAGFMGYDDCPIPCLSPYLCSERGSCAIPYRSGAAVQLHRAVTPAQSPPAPVNALRLPRDRYYRGSCPHGSWFALLREEAAVVASVEGICPVPGCTVHLTTQEPLPSFDDGQSIVESDVGGDGGVHPPEPPTSPADTSCAG